MVDKEIILKRINILEPIYKRLNSLQDGYRQNIAVIGQEGVGKTTILKYLSSSFKRPQLTFSYVDLSCCNFEFFALKLLGSMLFGYLAEKGLILKDDFDYLSRAIAQFLPHTAESLKIVQQLVEKKRFNEAFQNTLECADIFTKESGNKLVLIIDEFHLLEDMGIKNAFVILGKKIMLQKSVAFIIASSNVQKANRILSEKLSLLFGNFEIINAHPLDQRTSKEFIANIISPLTIPQIYTDFIINLTWGFPLHLKIISKELTQLAEKNSTGSIDSRIITGALYNLLSRETGILNEKFNNLVECVCRHKNEQGKNTYKENLEIIFSVSQGVNTLNGIGRMLHRSKQQLTNRISKFVEQGLMSKNGSFLKISDPLFELWIRLVLAKKINRINDDELEFKNHFIQSITAMIEAFELESKRNFLERISEIFLQFQDESIIFDRGRLKLPKFQEVRPMAFEEIGIREGLYGRGQQHIWITGLKPERINEADVAGFAQECKKVKNKRLKKILIAFADMDLNASLLAKEEKIQTWNLQHINLLLNFFGKPKIIHYQK